MSPDPAEHELDALVIGAGLAGLLALHRLRELGLRVRAYDGADDVGGTWWWHYYPGARLDTEGPVYQYLFSRELYDGWGWSERYPAGYEVQRWLRFVADRLDLRPDVALGERIVSAHWDDGRGRWTVRTDRGGTVRARFVVSCAGLESASRAEILGRDGFGGLVMDTAHWPERGPDLAGLRVGVVDVGTVGVQLIERVVDEVGGLTVFVARPPFVLPRVNPHYGWQEREAYRSRFDALGAVRHTVTGDEHDPGHVRADHPPAARAAILAEAWRDGSQKLVRATFAGVGTDPEVTAEAAAYLRRAMRERLGDDRLAEVVVPHGSDDDELGTRPVPLESGYLAALTRSHVEVVDLGATPIVRLRPAGVELADGTVRGLDVVVLTDEPDRGPPALTRVDVRGRDGRAPDVGRASVLGLAAPGVPNLLTAALPLGPHRTRSTVLQIQVEWITEAIRALLADGYATMEATRADVEPAGEPSWSVGDYHRRCTEEAAAGYPSFTRAREPH